MKVIQYKVKRKASFLHIKYEPQFLHNVKVLITNLMNTRCIGIEKCYIRMIQIDPQLKPVHNTSKDVFQDSMSPSSPGKPNNRRFRSIDPTAKYFASGPNLTELILPVPDKSGNVLIQFHSALTLAT